MMLDFSELPESDALRAWREELEARAIASALLDLLEQRELEVSDATRARITGCSDIATLRTWIRRVLTARTADDVVASDEP